MGSRSVMSFIVDAQARTAALTAKVRRYYGLGHPRMRDTASPTSLSSLSIVTFDIPVIRAVALIALPFNSAEIICTRFSIAIYACAVKQSSVILSELLLTCKRGQAYNSHMGKRKNKAAQALGKLGGLKGGKARAAKLSPERRKEIAQNAAKARWGSDT